MTDIADVTAIAKMKVDSGEKRSPWKRVSRKKREKPNTDGQKQIPKFTREIHRDCGPRTEKFKADLFFFNILAKKKKASAVFASGNRLSDLCTSMNRTCNDFSSFLSDKIQKIRQSICTTISDMGYTFSLLLTREWLLHYYTTSRNLSLLYYYSVNRPWKTLKMQIVNMFTLLSLFPQALKTALIKPLFKKTAWACFEWIVSATYLISHFLVK